VKNKNDGNHNVSKRSKFQKEAFHRKLPNVFFIKEETELWHYHLYIVATVENQGTEHLKRIKKTQW
jgi:hypothetical protein